MRIRYQQILRFVERDVLGALQEIRSALRPDVGGISKGEHCFAARVELQFVHGVPTTPQKSPLRGGSIPLGFDVEAAWDANGAAIINPFCKFDENVDDTKKWSCTFYAIEISGGAYIEPAAGYAGTVRGVLWGG